MALIAGYVLIASGITTTAIVKRVHPAVGIAIILAGVSLVWIAGNKP